MPTDQPRGAAGKFISEEKAANVTPEDLPELVSKSSQMTGALKDLKQAKEEGEIERPLVSVNVNNPFSWILKWINTLRKKQTTTITFRLGVPLIALPVLVLALGSLFFSLGRITSPTPTPTAIPQATPSATIVSKVGQLKLIEKGEETEYFLLLPGGAALRLQIPSLVDTEALENKRILASGVFDSDSNTLKVDKLADLEVLPITPSPVPTAIPTPSPVPSESPSPSPQE